MKNDVMVSVRMPKRLHHDLKDLCMHNRFLDMSEAVRSIVRKRFMESTQIGLAKLSTIKTELNAEKQDRKRRELTLQIQKLSDELRKLGEHIDELQ